VEALATQVAGGKTLPSVVLAQLVAKTEGVPLFVEELTQMVLASGLLREEPERYALTGPLPPLALPPTVHESITARLEQLGEAKTVAQVGAVWGRGFTEAQLQAVAPLDRRQLTQALMRLVAADLLWEIQFPPRVTYVFKHALMQEAAYTSLPLVRRQQVHRQVAQVLAEQFAETVATQPELVAQHYTAAGLYVEAIPYWQRAGQRAVERLANVEAVSHFTQGLTLLKALPETPERLQQEIDLLIALGPALISSKSPADPAVEHTYARARELCQQAGERSQRFPVLWGLWWFHVVRANLQAAQEFGEQLLALGQDTHDSTVRLAAHRALGTILFYLGELPQARAHLEQGIAIYDLQRHRSLAFLYGENLGAVCLSFIAWVLVWLGYPDQALACSRKALALARELQHPFSLARALEFTGVVHIFRREPSAAQELAEATIALATEQALPFWLAGGTMVRGCALAEQGQEEEGIACIRQGLATLRATGLEQGHSYWETLLAKAYGKMGQVAEGLRVLAERLAFVDKTGERFYHAELYRIKGKLVLGLSADYAIEAEICFHQALDMARHQQAKLLELRAAMSLSRLWQRRGRRTEARQLLAPIYGWFTEGFDTADLQEAKALLAALA
jgi:predicted ATPase